MTSDGYPNTLTAMTDEHDRREVGLTYIERVNEVGYALMWEVIDGEELGSAPRHFALYADREDYAASHGDPGRAMGHLVRSVRAAGQGERPGDPGCSELAAAAKLLGVSPVAGPDRSIATTSALAALERSWQDATGCKTPKLAVGMIGSLKSSICYHVEAARRLGAKPQTYAWVIYDGRAETTDVDDCTVYSTADSEAEAFAELREFTDGVVYRYVVEDGELVRGERRRPGLVVEPYILEGAYAAFCIANPDQDTDPPAWVVGAQEVLGQERACELHRQASQHARAEDPEDARAMLEPETIDEALAALERMRDKVHAHHPADDTARIESVLRTVKRAAHDTEDLRDRLRTAVEQRDAWREATGCGSPEVARAVLGSYFTPGDIAVAAYVGTPRGPRPDDEQRLSVAAQERVICSNGRADKELCDRVRVLLRALRRSGVTDREAMASVVYKLLRLDTLGPQGEHVIAWTICEASGWGGVSS